MAVFVKLVLAILASIAATLFHFVDQELSYPTLIRTPFPVSRTVEQTAQRIQNARQRHAEIKQALEEEFRVLELNGGWVVTATKSAETSAETMFLCVHGVGSSRAECSHLAFLVLRQCQSCAVAMYDSPNCGESMGEGGVTYGEKEAIPVLNSIETLRIRANASKLFLVGMSGGAAAVLLAAYGRLDQKREAFISGVISFASFASVPVVITERFIKKLPRCFEQVALLITKCLYTCFVLKHRICDMQEAIWSTPLNVLAEANINSPPLLLVHGRNDELVPLENFELLLATATKKLNVVASLIVPNTGHVFEQLLDRSQPVFWKFVGRNGDL